VWLTGTPYDGDGTMRFSFDSAGVSYGTNTDLGSGFLGVIYTINSNMVITLQKRG
jgi:hypothetical protein